MSTPAPAATKPAPPETFIETLARFGRWCMANPLELALLVSLVTTLIYFYLGYKPLSGGYMSFGRWTEEAWGKENDLEHGPLILPGAIIVAWLHRADFARALKQPSWMALWALMPGILFFVAAVWTQQARVALVALPILIVGSVWFVWGWECAKIAVFPSGLLLFMIPIGYLLGYTEPLQRLVAVVVERMSDFVGIAVDRDGVKLESPDGSIRCEVAGGCSGIRSIVAMTMLSLLYVHFSERPLWKKGLILAMTLPFAVVGNVFRVFTIVLVAKWFGNAAATGPWHDISGFIVTIPIAVMSMIWFGELLDRDWSGLKRKLLARDEVRRRPVATAPAAEKPILSKPAGKPTASRSPISYDY
jgi:exosortase